MSKLLSIVIPAFNEEGNIANTAKTVLDIMDEADIPCELVFVSDGSKDKTFSKISEAAKADKRIHGVQFSRNFGKESAISAGLAAGRGDCFAVMDCDLQHPPKTIVEMYRKWEEGFDIVEGIKSNRGKESWLHKRFAGLFYMILSALTGFDMRNTSDFKLIDRKVADILLQMPERQTFFRALTFWVGFNSCQVEYEVAERQTSESKWSVKSLIRYAVTNIVSFSCKPLNIVTYMGALSLIFGALWGIYTFIYWVCGKAVEGFTTVILLMLMLGGCILLGLGIIGQYIAAIYTEVKQRPRYIVQYKTPKDDDREEEHNNAEK